ncbi:MAG: hypothetical protein ACM3O7_00340 [Acidobacteriota bacterium]
MTLGSRALEFALLPLLVLRAGPAIAGHQLPQGRRDPRDGSSFVRDQEPPSPVLAAGEEILLPPAAAGGEVELNEVDGHSLVARLTPVGDDGTALDGGRVIVLVAHERRALSVSAVFAAGDLAVMTGLRVEVLEGKGRLALGAPWARMAGATVSRAVRRRLARAERPSSETLIDAAEAAGTLNHETAVLYHVYAIFGDARLPDVYRGDDTGTIDSIYLGNVVAEWNSYSAATQAALQPFLIPPAYQQSFQGVAAGISALDSPPSCSPLSNWDFVENTSGHVRVWFDVDTGDRTVAGVFLLQAENTIWPALQTLMGLQHLPLSDGGFGCNGGSERLDIYLADVPQSTTVPYPLSSGCSNSPVFILLRRSTTAALLAHEMFHAFQWSFPLAGCIASPDYRWWAEASAEWVQDYVYPHDQHEHESAKELLFDPKKPLDLYNDPHWYGAYLLPFFVYRSTGHADFVRQSWENGRTSKAVQALNDALASVGPGDLAKVWPDVALHNWNRAPVDQYTTWDSFPNTLRASSNGATINASALPYSESTLTVDLPHLSATYKHFVFSGTEISSVAFWNGVTYDLEKQAVPIIGPLWNPQTPNPDAVKGIKVQALYKVNNVWTQEDWTEKPYALFCRDLAAERLQELVLVISNSRLDDTAGSFKPVGMAPVLWVSGIGCYQWKGTASYTAAVSGGTQNDTVPDLVFTRVASQQPPSIDYLATGNVTVTMGGGCSGGGTVPLSNQLSVLTTYNFLPADSSAVQSYKGQGEETAMVPVTCQGHPGMTIVGPWLAIYPPNPPTFPYFTVSPDGKHMTGIYSPANGIAWQWDLHAEREP